MELRFERGTGQPHDMSISVPQAVVKAVRRPAAQFLVRDIERSGFCADGECVEYMEMFCPDAPVPVGLHGRAFVRVDLSADVQGGQVLSNHVRLRKKLMSESWAHLSRHERKNKALTDDSAVKNEGEVSGSSCVSSVLSVF